MEPTDEQMRDRRAYMEAQLLKQYQYERYQHLGRAAAFVVLSIKHGWAH